jgi:hypothetical protein
MGEGFAGINDPTNYAVASMRSRIKTIAAVHRRVRTPDALTVSFRLIYVQLLTQVFHPQMIIDDNLFAGAAATPLRLMNEPQRGRHGSMKYPA